MQEEVEGEASANPFETCNVEWTVESEPTCPRQVVDTVETECTELCEELPAKCGESVMSVYQMECLLSALETRAYDRLLVLASQTHAHALGIEFDEDTVCDVCRSVSVFSFYLPFYSFFSLSLFFVTFLFAHVILLLCQVFRTFSF